MAHSTLAEELSPQGSRFALTKFRPPALPATLITRPQLHQRLAAGAGRRLTLVAGPAGAGKSVLLADWAAARPPGLTSWLSGDQADADPVRFWTGFIRSTRAIEPWFGADAADLLASDKVMSADVTASLANDAAKLPAGSAIIVDDCHLTTAETAQDLSALVERWPAGVVQLVLSGRMAPSLRQHRLRVSGQLSEIRGAELYFSLAEARDLLSGFDVRISEAELALLHSQSEGWPAALHMAALSLRGTTDPARRARALELRGRSIAEYFVSEVLDRQPREVAQFMLDTSVLAGVLTEDVCSAVTGRPDAEGLLRSISSAHLFLVPLDEEQTSFRYHRLVRQLLRAELRARGRAAEQALQLRAAEWFEAAGDTRRAAHHYLAAEQADRALVLLQDRAVPDFLHVPATPVPVPLVLSTVEPPLLVETPERLLGLAAELLLSGDMARGGECLDLLDRSGRIAPDSRLAARFAALASFRCGVAGQLEKAAATALQARAIQQRTGLADPWNMVVPLTLVHVYSGLGDFPAAEREAAAVLSAPDVTEPVKLVMVPGVRALACFEAGLMAEAAEACATADAAARRLGFDEHFLAVAFLRVQSGLALKRCELETAERLTERVLSITEQRWPLFEFEALLDRAQVWEARGQVSDALASVAAARQALTAGASPALLARADELEAVLRLSLGDLRTPVELARSLPTARRSMVLARVALAAGDHQGMNEQLRAAAAGHLTPHETLVRRVLVASAAIDSGDPVAAGLVGGALHAARGQGLLDCVVTTAPQITGYLIEHAAELRPDPLVDQLVAVALEARAARRGAAGPGPVLADPLTPAERRVLALLPTSTYLQIANTLFVSRNTVKTHLRSIYQKLGVASRSEAVGRAVDLRLL
jgi:LuxR family maltose regulon positive regulatory protein